MNQESFGDPTNTLVSRVAGNPGSYGSTDSDSKIVVHIDRFYTPDTFNYVRIKTTMT